VNCEQILLWHEILTLEKIKITDETKQSPPLCGISKRKGRAYFYRACLLCFLIFKLMAERWQLLAA
jgi:hypothetical protein